VQTVISLEYSDISGAKNCRYWLAAASDADLREVLCGYHAARHWWWSMMWCHVRVAESGCACYKLLCCVSYRRLPHWAFTGCHNNMFIDFILWPKPWRGNMATLDVDQWYCHSPMLASLCVIAISKNTTEIPRPDLTELWSKWVILSPHLNLALSPFWLGDADPSCCFMTTHDLIPFHHASDIVKV